MTDSRLEAFAARKEAEARAAVLSPWVTDSRRHVEDLRGIGNGWSRALFDGDFYLSRSPSPDLPSTSLVFVESRDGNTVAKDPSVLGGGDTDKHLVYEGLSRVAADAVMAGAETVRSGNIVFSVWHPELVSLRQTLGLPRHPVQIVATLRGLALDRGLLYNEPDLRVLLVTTAQGESTMHGALVRRPWITTIVESAGALPEAFRQIRRLGIERISCVGGRTLARQLVNASLVQDLYLTTGNRNGGETGTPADPKPPAAQACLNKRGTGRDADVRFAHLRFAAP